jgi:nucleoside-diphosphate-sugar epimerase
MANLDDVTGEVLILGCGFTGRRAASLLVEQGHSITATTRNPSGLQDLADRGVHVVEVDLNSAEAEGRVREICQDRCRVLHSVPSLPQGRDVTILDGLSGFAARVVYLSTTGVYGDAHFVDANTPPNPRDERERARVRTEQAVRKGPWEALILRPAAIYGPGRGAHVSLRNTGDNFVSRIHVDDLAALACAALFSEIEGAYPVADEQPCTSQEMAEFCARLLGVPVPAPVPDPRRNNRRVDGSEIRRLLGVTLRYPSYREGIPASLRSKGR